MIVRSESTGTLAGVCILVVEDDALIALDLEDLLVSRGAGILGPVPSVPAALEAIGSERPDIAVLDVNLRGTMSTPVAKKLNDERVPFVLTTGYGRRHLDHPVLLSVPLVPKPVNAVELERALMGLLNLG